MPVSDQNSHQSNDLTCDVFGFSLVNGIWSPDRSLGVIKFRLSCENRTVVLDIWWRLELYLPVRGLPYGCGVRGVRVKVTTNLPKFSVTMTRRSLIQLYKQN